MTNWLMPKSPIGIHAPSTVGAQTYPNAFSSLDDWMKFLVERMGMGCYLWLSEPGFSVVRPIEAAAKAGMMVTARVQPDGGEPHPWMRVDTPNVRRAVSFGLSYVQCGNEPDSKGEWTRGDGGVQHGKENRYALVRQVADMCDKVIAGGARALLPSMNAGYPDYDREGNVTDDGSDRVSHLNFFKDASDLGLLGAFQQWARDGKLGMAAHNRPANHPLAYPNDAVCLGDNSYFQNVHFPGSTEWQRLQRDSVTFDKIGRAHV